MAIYLFKWFPIILIVIGIIIAVTEGENKSNFKSLTIIGIGIIILGLNTFISSFKSQMWPQIQGTILSSKISDNSDSSSIDVLYEYKVNNKSYVGNRISFGDATERSTEEVKKLYKVFSPYGKSVIVYYNPKNPKQSVLENGIDFGSFFPILMGLILLIAGLIKLKNKTQGDY